MRIQSNCGADPQVRGRRPRRPVLARGRGAAAIQFLVILVPVLFGLIGFAVDLGILYSMKGELKAGASAMALAAAQQLIGTDTSTSVAATALQATGNRYYFHGLPIGQTTGSLASTISGPAYYATAADAIASGLSPGAETGGSAARYVRVTVTGQTQLLFWSFLPIVAGDRIVTVQATAVAGISAPLCQACSIEPFAVAALNQADTTDFGYVVGTKYSLSFLCTLTAGATLPPVLPGASQQISYLLLNHIDPNAVFPDEGAQAFQDGAGGLPGTTSTAQACLRVNTTETVWPSAVINTCSSMQVAPVVTDALCGMDARFESATPTACTSVPSLDTLSTVYQPDTDANDYDAYANYTGNGRRIITIPIVDTLSGSAAMTVLGFRQFLLIPSQGGANINPGDPYGRVVAMYIGSVAPVKQGRFDGCQQAAGPGKVVIHQ
jgi:Flp pilus assembly protein TadG